MGGGHDFPLVSGPPDIFLIQIALCFLFKVNVSSSEYSKITVLNLGLRPIIILYIVVYIDIIVGHHRSVAVPDRNTLHML
ncbi:hypothetical protein C8J56DRAFT_932081, partial [Mycena floridula]